MKIKNWYTIKELEILTGKSDKTIRRKRDEVIKLKPDTKWFRTKSKPHKYHLNFVEELIPQHFFELMTSNKQYQNTIDCMKNKDSLEYHLSRLDWNYFVTISYQDNLSSEKCFAVMNELYDYMEAYSFTATTRMFFTTEPFSNRYGHHNHMVLKTNGTGELVEKFIERYTPKSRIEVIDYDPYKAGVFYTAKHKHKGNDWDLLGNNLAMEGIELNQINKSA